MSIYYTWKNIKSKYNNKWLNKVNVKLSDTQLKKLKSAVKNKTGTTLRISLRVFAGNDLHMNYYLQQDKKQN